MLISSQQPIWFLGLLSAMPKSCAGASERSQANLVFCERRQCASWRFRGAGSNMGIACDWTAGLISPQALMIHNVIHCR